MEPFGFYCKSYSLALGNRSWFQGGAALHYLSRQYLTGKFRPMDREVIIPEEMREIVARAGYAPAIKVGDTIYVVGQVGRTRDLQVIEDPREQFRAIWENLGIVLEAADCTFDDVVEMTSYHVEMSKHMDIFRTAKNEVFPKGTYAWTRIGVSELAHPGLLAEVKCVAVKR